VDAPDAKWRMYPALDAGFLFSGSWRRKLEAGNGFRGLAEGNWKASAELLKRPDRIRVKVL
jgi:hypothetical protein